jgi:putrescine aminotransferase
MGALLLVKDKAKGTLFPPEQAVGMVCRGHCFGNGLIMRAVGDRMIVAPPLVITAEQIEELGRLIRLCLDKTWADVNDKGWLG